MIPPAAWTQVTLVRSSKPNDTLVGASQCRWVTGCVAWQVDVDGNVTVSREKQSTATTLSPDDLAEVDAALRSERLRSEEQQSFTARAEAIVGPFVSIMIERGSDPPFAVKTITGCLSVQQELQRIVDVITKY